MATYKEIFGRPIKVLASDPTDAESEGQIWYNTTLVNFRTILNSGAWSSSALMINARNAMGSTGIQTAALAVAGQTSSYVATVEEYNGSGWAAGTVYPLSAVGPYVTGTVTAGLAYGGMTYPPSVARTETFEFDGSTWTASGALPVARGAGGSSAGFGSQTAAVQSGGRTAPAAQNTSSEYNGTAWTAGNTINTARYAQAGTGILTAGVIAGGAEPADSVAVEEYDGTDWTSVTSIPTATNTMGSSNQGPQTSAIFFGGGNPDSNRTLVYDGTNWTTGANLATARLGIGGAGVSGTSGLGFGGYINPTTSQSALTEEYNRSTSVITAAAWSSGTVYPTSAAGTSGGGTKTAGWVTAGAPPGGPSTATFLYDGSSWTGTGALNVARNGAGSAGSQAAGLIMGGTTSPAPSPSGRNNITEEFNGSAWSVQNLMAQTRDSLGGLGTQTAGLAFGGFISGPWPSGSTGVVEEYNGASWTSATALPGPAGKSNIRGAGTQTAGITCGGGPSNTNVANEYNGASWTAAPNFFSSTSSQSTGGIQTNALFVGGEPVSTTAAIYNGTTWVTSPSITTGRQGAASMGFGTIAMAMVAGNTPPMTNVTEEFSESSSALNYKTITTS